MCSFIDGQICDPAPRIPVDQLPEQSPSCRAKLPESTWMRKKSNRRCSNGRKHEFVVSDAWKDLSRNAGTPVSEYQIEKMSTT
eukprot:37774-Alexandrium_andersonii.AAC.1